MSRKRSRHEDDIREKKRARLSSSSPTEIEDRLESLIFRVGEKSASTLESNLEGLSSVLISDLPNFKPKIMRILSECIVKSPHKTTVYTTLVGLLNAKDYNFGGEFLEFITRNLKDCLKANKYEDARLILRFLADLVNCYVVFSSSFLNLANLFINEVHNETAPQARTDWFVYAVLTCLPWIGRELFEKKDHELDNLLRAIENYLSKRKKVHHQGLRVWESDTPNIQEEYLDCLWTQINKLRAEKWVERHINRPYIAFDGLLCEALQHPIPTITIPIHRDDCKYPYPSVIFRLFDYTDCPETLVLPGAHSIDRYLIEEELRTTLKLNYQERKDCAAMLLNFPGKHKIPLEYMIVEVILGEMFRLPVSNYLIVCLGSILLELCKSNTKTMPLVLAQAVELLFERLDTMNPECVNRFSEWFSYHLSNFMFCWQWESWVDCLSLEPLHPKQIFVRETFIRCIRLSYYQRIKSTIPEALHPLLPSEFAATCKYFQEGTSNLVGSTHSKQLLSAIKDRCTAEEILSIIKDVPNPIQDDDETSHNPLKIDVFVQTLLFTASKSITHSISAIAKYLYVFKTLSIGEDAQICILKSTFEIWRNNHQILGILIEKYLKAELVDCATVVNWIFSKDMYPEFTNYYVWDILHRTIGQVVKSVKTLQKDLDEARAKQHKVDEDEDEDDFMDHSSGRPSEESIERMEDKLESAQQNQKKLFLIVFQHFIILLSEHIVLCEKERSNYNNSWFRLALGRLQSTFFNHHDIVFQYANTLEAIMFTGETDPNISGVFHRFSALQN